MNKTFVSPSFFKQRATQLQKEKFSTWHQALDEAAKEFGFSNYKNYRNLSEANRKQPQSYREVIVKNISSENDKFKKMDIAISSIIKFKIPFSDQLSILQLFQNSDGSYDSVNEAVCKKLKLREDLKFPDYGVQPCLQYVCEKLDLMKDEIQKYFLKDANTDDGQGDLHDVHPDIVNIEEFIANESSVNNLIYRIVNDMLHVDGDYEITYKYDSEELHLIPEDKEDPHYEYFKNEYHKDRMMAGTFGVTINRAKKITLEHADG